MKTRVVLGCVVAGLLGAGACAYGGDLTHPTPPLREAGPDLDGRDLYLRDCAWCHAADGEGTSRGPDLVTGSNGPAFTHFMLTTGRMPIADPAQRTRRQPRVYSEQEIAEIVEYVSSFGAIGPDIPSVQVAAGHIGEGLELYQENCAACHAPTLVGGALTESSAAGSTSLIAPDLREASPTEIAEAMLVGPGSMPVFGTDTFTEQQVDSIVAYVVAQQDPDDQGGAPIGRVGPVAEGAVAWLVGLAATLVLIRWIGTKVKS
jgi:ubiquinol-cytochrome c reductase cytochrome c subunit